MITRLSNLEIIQMIDRFMTPEERIMLAVLERACVDFYAIKSEMARNINYQEEAQAWFNDIDNHEPFSYNWITEMLGCEDLSQSDLRILIMKWRRRKNGNAIRIDKELK